MAYAFDRDHLVSVFVFLMPIENSPDGGNCRSSNTTREVSEVSIPVAFVHTSSTVNVTGCVSAFRVFITATNPRFRASSMKVTPVLWSDDAHQKKPTTAK